MGKAKRYLIILALIAGSLASPGQQKEKTFQDIDRESLALYEQGRWKELTELSNQALKEGIDYYYLRLRAGIACFETRRYMKAALHFREALNFNEKDPVAAEYLYGCYLQLNRKADAIKTFNELPASLREKLANSLPKLHQAEIQTGPVFSNQMGVFDTLDLDGEDNIYGETDMIQDGYYFSTGLLREFKKGYDFYGGYTFIKLNKNKHAEIGDTLSVDDIYPLIQHQFYLCGKIPFGKGYSVLPALNVVLDRYETFKPQTSPDSASYVFPVEQTKLDAFIGYISLTKDFYILQTSLFAAYSNLNAVNQFQAGFGILAFPFGNLDLYLSSKLLNHNNDGRNNIIFEQMAGLRIFSPLWVEMNCTFGQMLNYHENNAFVVYNFAEKMKFKGGAKLIYMAGTRLQFTAEYLFLLREGEYMSYMLKENQETVPVIKTKDFQNQIALIGLKWNF